MSVLDAPIAMPGVRGVLPSDERDFRILVDQVETLRVELGLQRTAYFDELMRRLKGAGEVT